MIGPLLISLALTGQSPEADANALIAQLGATRYQEREAAAAELERLGEAALPALLQSKDAKDPEIRLRVAGLIGRIEGKLLTQPTRVRLDFENAPITEVVEILGRRAGIKLTLVPETAPQWRTRRVTLRENDPVTFWIALDRLCEAGALQYNVGMHSFPQGRGRSFPLYDGSVMPTTPVSDTGPFRVSVTGLHHQRDVSFPPIPRVGAAPPGGRAGTPQITEQFHVQLQVVSEPRLGMAQDGMVRIDEAIDEKGQALFDPDNRGAFAQRSAAYSGMASGSTIQLQAALKRPEQPGRIIKRIRGAIPVTVSTRKPDPVVVKLKDPEARTGRNDDYELTVHDVKVHENTRQTMIELSVRPLSADSEGLSGGPTARGPSVNQQQRIEVADSTGEILSWYQSGFNSETERLTLTLISQGGQADQLPAEIRYYGLVRASTLVEFDFHDLPLP